LRTLAGRELWAFLDLLALAGFVVAQPLLDVLGKSPDFLLFRQAEARDIVALAAAITLIPPLALWALEALVGLAGRRRRRAAHVVLVAGLLGLLGLEAAKKLGPLRGPCWRRSAGPPFGSAAATYPVVRPRRHPAAAAGQRRGAGRARPGGLPWLRGAVARWTWRRARARRRRLPGRLAAGAAVAGADPGGPAGAGLLRGRPAGRAGGLLGRPGDAQFPPPHGAVGGAVPMDLSEFFYRAQFDQHRSLAGARARLLGFVTHRDSVSPVAPPRDRYEHSLFGY
jgi:hypothetical protein